MSDAFERRLMDAKEQDSRLVPQADIDLRDLMGRREFRRHWWESIQPLFERDLASDHGLRMARVVAARDEAARRWETALRVCPEQVVLAMREAHERADSGSDAGRPTE